MRTLGNMVAAPVLLIAIALAAGCDSMTSIPGLGDKSSDGASAPNPVAERLGSAVPASVMNPAIDQLGNAVCTFALTMEGNKVTSDPAVMQPVLRVANRLEQAAKQSPELGEAASKIKWEVKVLKDDTKENAYGCPGGKILVYTGVFRIAKDDSGLAAILGHEMTHVLNRHTSPPLNAATISSAGVIAAGIIHAEDAKSLSPEAKGVVAAFGFGALVGISQSFSREQEMEADRGGVLLISQAGYNPDEYLGFLNRLMNPTCAKPDQLPEFLSSHPDPAVRYKQMQTTEVLGQAQKLYDKSAKTEQSNLPGEHCA